MKKILALLLAGAVILGVSACNKKDDQPAAPGEMEAAEKLVQGSVTDATMNTLVIDAGGDKIVTFSTEDADKTAADGIMIGDEVSVYYTGTLKTGANDVNKAIRIEKEEAPVDEEDDAEGTAISATASLAEGEDMVEGIIDDASMNTLTMITTDGVTVSFSTMEADKTGADGLTIGTAVRVYYEGELATDGNSITIATRVEQ